MMIRLATFTDEALKRDSELDLMFCARAAVFRDRLGWNVEVVDGREIDRYDRFEDPIYMLAYQGERLVGSMRFLPTTGETMLNNEFAAMFDEPVTIRSPTVWECTRFCVHPGADNLNTSRDLFVGMHGLASKNGIDTIVGLYDDRMTRIYRRLGWSPIPLARSERPGETLIVGIWEVTADALASMQAKAEAGALHGRAA